MVDGGDFFVILSVVEAGTGVVDIFPGAFVVLAAVTSLLMVIMGFCVVLSVVLVDRIVDAVDFIRIVSIVDGRTTLATLLVVNETIGFNEVVVVVLVSGLRVVVVVVAIVTSFFCVVGSFKIVTFTGCLVVVDGSVI